jgi:hypothetical protein
MENIQPTHATFEQAKLLKEKKFIMKCRSYYLKGYDYPFEGVDDEYWGDNKFKNWNADVIGIKPFEGFTSAPEQWQVVEWLRVKHGIWVSVQYIGVIVNRELIEFHYEIKYCKELPNLIRNENSFNSPQEAYSAAFDYILNNLI